VQLRRRSRMIAIKIRRATSRKRDRTWLMMAVAPIKGRVTARRFADLRLAEPRLVRLIEAGKAPVYRIARSITFLTLETCHRPPRAVRTPRSFSA
jgi:hypothetical protein